VRVLSVTDAAFASMPDLRTPGELPSHARIERWLAGAVDAGELLVGDRLPPEGELSAALGVSRMTLRQALAALESRGLLHRKRGRGGGTFVIRPRIECDLTGLPGFTEQMRRAQVRAGARMVSASLRESTPEVAEALTLRPRAQVYRIVRVRLANREPLALEETFLPASDFPDLLDHRLTGSLYSLMRRRYGLVPCTAREWLEPVIADDEQAALLNTAPGSALMLVTRTAYAESGKPLEYAHDRYRADRTRIGLRTGIEQKPGAAGRLRATSTLSVEPRADGRGPA
jgi:GntR family transcriptional regulator